MTLPCVSIFVDSGDDVPLALTRAADAVAGGARLVEWRLDAVAEEADGLEAIRRLLAGSPAPCIVTIRSESEGGTWQGDEADRTALLEAIGIGEDPPAYIDLELESWRRSANLRQKIGLAIDHAAQVRDIHTRLILSSHDFHGRPADLLGRIEAMVGAEQCAVAKVAYRARTIRDSLEMIDLLAERGKPMIGLCMGEAGLLTRILAPKFGGFLTFAAATGSSATAPGQPTIADLVDTYRFSEIGPKTKVFGVVGDPVGHSRSPAVHNRGFRAAGIDAVYVPLPVLPGWESFKASIAECIHHDRLDFGGCSVTLPHKANLVRFAEEIGAEITPLAARIGAANTLVVRRSDDGSLIGLEVHNTDATAAIRSLAAGFDPDGEPAAVLGGRRVAVLGAGGVARAVVAGLLDVGARVVIHNRTAERAASIVRDLAPHGEVSTCDDPRELAAGGFDAYVNATPVGMEGGIAPEASPLPPETPLDASTVVMDTVYTPRTTPLLVQAAAAGARVVDGLGMFIGQAEAQFRLFSGESPEPGLFERVLSEA